VELHFDDCLDILANEAPFEGLRLIQTVDAQKKGGAGQRVVQESEVDLQF